MVAIQEILEADHENVEISKAALLDVFENSLAAVDAAIKTYERMGRVWGKRCRYDEYQSKIDKWAEDLGLEGHDVLTLLRSADLVGEVVETDSTAGARIGLERGSAVIARAWLTVRLLRDFTFGIADILRLRITVGLGFIRLQAESAGLLKLMADRPEVGEEWFNAFERDQGKAFFYKWREKIRSRMRVLRLYSDYAEASGLSLHSTPWGVSLGVLLGAKTAGPGVIDLRFQETDDRSILYFFFARYLRFQRKLLTQLKQFYPELSEDDLNEIDVKSFLDLESATWARAVALLKSLGPGGVGRILRGG